MMILVNPSETALSTASWTAVTFADLLSLSLVLLQPVKRVWPERFFPKYAIPFHLPFFVPPPSVVIRISQLLSGCHWFLMVLRSWSAGCWLSSLGCMYLLKRDLAVSIVSIGLGSLPSKRTWFLCVHMHQRVVRINSNAYGLPLVSFWFPASWWIQWSTWRQLSMMCLVLISTPNQTALAKVHWRKVWLSDSLLEFQRLQIESQWMPLLFSSILTGRACWRSVQVNVMILWGSLSFHRVFQVVWCLSWVALLFEMTWCIIS